MREFRRRSIVVQAEQWFPDKNIEGVDPWCVCDLKNGVRGASRLELCGQEYPMDHGFPKCSGSNCGFTLKYKPSFGKIETPEGTKRVQPGDWVVFYPEGKSDRFSPENFKAVYEAID